QGGGARQFVRRPDRLQRVWRSVLHLPMVLVGRSGVQLWSQLPEHGRQSRQGEPVRADSEVPGGRRLRRPDLLHEDRALTTSDEGRAAARPSAHVSLSVMLPTFANCGSTVIVNVPPTAAVKVNVAPNVNTLDGESADSPSGPVPETVEAGIVTPLNCRVSVCPAEAVNVSWAFWPGVAIVMGTAGPPGAIGLVTSGGTL